MKTIPVALFTLLLATATTAQAGVALAPSGQPVLAAIRPHPLFMVPLAVVEVAGNPAFQIHSEIITPAVPPGSLMLLLLGTPNPPPIPVGPPLFPGYGLPGWLAMDNILAIAFAGVAGTAGNPPYLLPIPPGLGPLGLCLSAQNVVFVPGGLGLTGATGIII